MKHHVFMYKPYRQNKFLAFCAGSIIGPTRVLSTAHCYLTNRKRLVRGMKSYHVVAGAVEVTIERDDNVQQWRQVERIYSQKFLRHPAYSIVVLKLTQAWFFNAYVRAIPIATIDHDYNGICYAPAIRTSSSWAENKILYRQQMLMIPRHVCEVTLQRSCVLFYCTQYEKDNPLSPRETEGGGLVCRNARDPAEVGDEGVLVGVTSLINVHLPTLHNRVGLFNKWITDFAVRPTTHYLCFVSALLLSLSRVLYV